MTVAKLHALGSALGLSYTAACTDYYFMDMGFF